MYKENLISKKMRIFAERNDWMIRDEYIYGKEQGHLFTGIDGKKTKSFITPVPGILQDQSEELMQLLERNKDTMKLEEFEITDEFLCIRIKDSASLKTDDIEFVLALLTGMLKDLNIVAVNRCQECGELGADKEEFVYDLYCYMHQDCSSKFHTTGDDSESEDTSEGDSEHIQTEIGNDLPDISGPEPGTIKKILYTLVGAFLGSIPWLIMPFLLDVINDLLKNANADPRIYSFVESLLTCICAYLVSYFAVVGFRLSGAKISKRNRWTIGIISVSVVVLTQFSYLAVLIIKEPAVKLSFSNYITNLVNYSFYTKMLINAAIGIVFTLIAVLPFFDDSRSSKKIKKDISPKTEKPESENDPESEKDSE